jgi:hypothetical protein
VFKIPQRYLKERTVLGFDRIDYGVGGIVLLSPADLPDGQIGYSVTPEGTMLAGDSEGDWRFDWLVIGNEAACGDPIFMSINPPYPVFTAIHGQGSWNARLVASSLDIFWKCLMVFADFATDRSNPVQLQRNPPGDTQITAYLKDLQLLCDGNEEAIEFWSVQAEIGM